MHDRILAEGAFTDIDISKHLANINSFWTLPKHYKDVLCPKCNGYIVRIGARILICSKWGLENDGCDYKTDDISIIIGGC